jgi:hypothetical protein
LGFFTEEEVGSLTIERMILHVVGGKTFTPEAERTVEHAQFFIDRIVETDVASVYSFDPKSQTKAQLEQIAAGSTEFEAGAQALSKEFSRVHVGGSIDGALFIFELGTDNPKVKLYSLVKYDYSEAIEQSEKDGASLLRKIVTAFIADKKAIQKAAIVRVTNGVADLSVATKDRARAAPAISDYFALFLNVARTLSDSELTEKTIHAIKLAITEGKAHMPNQDVPKAFRRAKAALRDRQEISGNAIVEAVLAAADDPADEVVRGRIRDIVLKKINQARLTGLEFRPDKQLLGRPPLRRIKTIEGVTLTYPDALETASVERTKSADGGEVITITTQRVTEDIVFADSSRVVEPLVVAVTSRDKESPVVADSTR